VAILDADKEGFLRSKRSLIQTIGRAARNSNGQVIMYADRYTDSMENAINETSRRRQIQIEHNQVNGIIPTSIIKSSNNGILDFLSISRRLNEQQSEYMVKPDFNIPLDTIPDLIQQLETQMQAAARKQEFEQAAQLRDRIKNLRNQLLGKRT
jgi:excinuclease ABC subunit B